MAITKGVTGSGNNPTSSLNIVATLSGPSTAGRMWVVAMMSRSATQTVTGITDNSVGGPMTWIQVGTYKNGATNCRLALFRTDVGTGLGGATTITVQCGLVERNTVVLAEEWIDVLQIGTDGNTSNTNANPTIAVTTQDANNYVVAAFGARGVTLPTARTGALDVVLASEGSAGQEVSGALVSNTAASASSVTCAETLAAATWVALAVELRTGPVQMAAWARGSNQYISEGGL